MGDLKITSPAFGHMEMIPSRYTCDGEDVNPPLKIENPPEGTKSFALIVDDPDAPVGIWVHWVVWNIPGDVREIAEDSVPEGARQGRNDWGKNKYGGPCPPSGTHRYFFKLYALDTTLDLPEGSTKSDLERAISGHVLGKAELIGLYRR
ncbi:MAG: YbhB/YbcL family Raf kinase inhibitor-like protein [Deltaproteobacteria bacterium]|nr:MAG: YbhB/YbcL family Raf kinase inhibitor-like protein [Deltaproteobacteria bacterium]